MKGYLLTQLDLEQSSGILDFIQSENGDIQVVAAFEKACGHAIAYEIKPRREGDIATCYCDPQKAKEELGWVAKYGIDEMCEDSWRWQSTNPDGYAK